MKLKKRYINVIAVILTLIITLSACSLTNNKLNNKDNESELYSNTANNYPIPKENRHGYDSQYEVCPSSSSNGYYKVNSATKTLWYYDAESESGMFLCSQTGCSHDTETCEAWIGNVESFTEYYGDIFAIRNCDNGNVEFIRKNILNGDIKVLCTWKSSKSEFYKANISNVSNGFAVVFLTKYTVNEESSVDVSNDLESEISYLRIDLNSGKKEKIFINENPETLTVKAMSKDYAVVNYIPEDELYSSKEYDLISTDEFFKSHKGDVGMAEYEKYCWSLKKRELRLYDLNTYKYSVIADTENDGMIPIADPNVVYEDDFIFQRDDTVYLLDITTGKINEFLTMKHLCNCWLMDHKVFMITCDKNEIYSFYYADIKDKTPIKINNKGNTECMEFSILYEGQSFFIDTNGKYVSKDNFYSENY